MYIRSNMLYTNKIFNEKISNKDHQRRYVFQNDILLSQNKDPIKKNNYTLFERVDFEHEFFYKCRHQRI